MQFNQNWLLGIETDFDWSRIKGTGTSNFFLGQIPPAASSFQATEDVEWFGTVRGRLGFLPANNVLIYGTGGFAYGRVADNVALNSGAGVGGFVIRPITATYSTVDFQVVRGGLNWKF